MNNQQQLEAMTHEELLKHALTLEEEKANTVYAIGSEDLVYVFSSMFSIPDEFVSPAMIEKARELMKFKFTFDEETSQISDFLNAKNVNWGAEFGTYSGVLDNDGDVLVYLSADPGDADPDMVLSEESDVQRFLEHVLGDDWEQQVTDSPRFHFTVDSLEDYTG